MKHHVLNFGPAQYTESPLFVQSILLSPILGHLTIAFYNLFCFFFFKPHLLAGMLCSLVAVHF